MAPAHRMAKPQLSGKASPGTPEGVIPRTSQARLRRTPWWSPPSRYSGGARGDAPKGNSSSLHRCKSLGNPGPPRGRAARGAASASPRGTTRQGQTRRASVTAGRTGAALPPPHPRDGDGDPAPGTASLPPGLFRLCTPVSLRLQQSKAGPAAAETKDLQGARAPAMLKITAAC